MSLDAAISSGGDPEQVKLGQSVLTLAVLSILLTAVVGELGVIITGPIFLNKKVDDQIDSDEEGKP
jgi:hypothetical protein